MEAPERLNTNPAPVHPSEVAPTLKPSSAYDPTKDAEGLKKTFGAFFGAKSSTIVDVVGVLSYAQRQQLREAYQKVANEDLVKKLESKTSFNLKKTLVALFNPPRRNDAISLRGAVKVSSHLPSLLCWTPHIFPPPPVPLFTRDWEPTRVVLLRFFATAITRKLRKSRRFTRRVRNSKE